MSTVREGEPCLAVARIDLGNVVLLPQPMAAVGDDAFAIVHGAKTAPPHPLHRRLPLGAIRLRSRRDDSLRHTGSLEFTPRKQVALCRYDWPDRLVGTLPPLLLLHHRQRRREHDGQTPLVRYDDLLPDPAVHGEQDPGQYKEPDEQNRSVLQDRRGPPAGGIDRRKKIAVKMGLHRDLRLDSLLTQPYTAEEIARIENFAEEIANEKMTGQALYDGRSLLAGEDPFVGNGHERRPDRIQRSGPRPPARKGNRLAGSRARHSSRSTIWNRPNNWSARYSADRKPTTHWSAAWRESPGEARRSAHDPHSAPARHDDGPRSYSYGIYGRSETRSAGHRRSGAYRDEYPELQTGAGGESGNGDALDSERSGGRIRRTDFGRRCRGQSAGGAYGPQPLCCERRDHPVRTGLGQGQGGWRRIRSHNTRKRTATIRAKSATPSGAVNLSRAKVRRSPRCSTCWA